MDINRVNHFGQHFSVQAEFGAHWTGVPVIPPPDQIGGDYGYGWEMRLTKGKTHWQQVEEDDFALAIVAISEWMNSG